MTLQGKVGESGLSISHPSTRRDLQGTWKLCSQGSEATGEEGQLQVLAVAKLALPWQARLLMVFYSPLLWPVHGSWKHAAPSIKSFFFFLQMKARAVSDTCNLICLGQSPLTLLR